MQTQTHTPRRRRPTHSYDMGWSGPTYTIRCLGPPGPLNNLSSNQKQALLTHLMQAPVGPGDTGEPT